MKKSEGRRSFMKGTAASVGFFLSGGFPAIMANSAERKKEEEVRKTRYDLLAELKKYKKIDSHVHIGLSKEPPEDNIEFCERLYIDRMFVSRPVTTGTGSGKGTPADFRESNDIILSAMRKYPGKLTGMFTLNVEHQKESLEEIKRCVDNNMIGLKVYYQVKINDPRFYPIIEKIIDLKMIILMHAEATLGIAGYRMKYDKKTKPNASRPEDFADIAKRYPEAMFQYAHLGGGPDWEYACKILKEFPNVSVDISGSNNAEGIVDFAVRELGENRVLFGTDNMFFQGVGKVLSSTLTESQKKKVFFENYNAILKKGNYHVH